MNPSNVLALMALACVPTVARAQIDTLLDSSSIIADQLRSQGYPCENPTAATRDAGASLPDQPVWTLRCDGVFYRVRLTPDATARVERLPE